ncbi:MAG TPA: outer membrane beta-barrel protein [Fibrobacteria bacterium]|nr:outer membrane beta-barrel protein [Fibrobacteria bacterium]HOX51558.1 outer membrane beta-barrel protein [Fibrobacteria bacterium]
MKRIALVLALGATFASAAQKVRLYGEAREVTTIPVLSNQSGTSGETNIGFTGAIGIQTPVNRQVLFDAHTGFFASRWGTSTSIYDVNVVSYFQSIGAGFQFQPTKVFGLGLGIAYDIALDNSVSTESNVSGASSSGSTSIKDDKNVVLAELGAAVKVSRHLDIVGNYRLPFTPYIDASGYSTKLHQINIGLRYTFNAKPQIEGVE